MLIVARLAMSRHAVNSRNSRLAQLSETTAANARYCGECLLAWAGRGLDALVFQRVERPRQQLGVGLVRLPKLVDEVPLFLPQAKR